MTKPLKGPRGADRLVVHPHNRTELQIAYSPSAVRYRPEQDAWLPTFAGLPGIRRRRADRKRQRRNRRGKGQG